MNRFVIFTFLLALILGLGCGDEKQTTVVGSPQGGNRTYRPLDQSKDPPADTKVLEEWFLRGVKYDRGDGVPIDYKEAAKWYRKAAEQGHPEAQYNLGVMLGTSGLGRGIEKNEKEAAKWYRKAADQGVPDAQYNLGWMYDNGAGVPENDKEAVMLYRKAAEQGHAKAQNELGFMYRYGEGALEDDVTAYAWYNIAAANGNENGKENKSELTEEMAPEQIAKAQDLSREMLEKNPNLLK